MGMIKYIMITGDFFAYPNRTVLDLEAALKNCKVGRLEDTVRRFFDDKAPELPGVSADDFVAAIGSALKKTDLMALGLSAKEANMIHTVHDAMEHLDETTVMLLPYCAKWQECRLRYDEDCLSCGKCTVGVAYELARMRGMEPITIVNFEHLWEVLSEMRKRGVRSYIGCCCEPFYTKHREDFEASGVAGILIDIDNTTCYELDQEKEAKLGTFKEETKLDVDLLKKIMGTGGIVSKERAEGKVSRLAEGEGIKAGKKERRCLYARDKGLEE
jgi:lipoate-protein ligase A